jgi:putative ABC transport system permease protein
LKESGRQSSRAHSRLRNALVVAEVALSLVLLVGAGLMLRTFAWLNQFDWGFDPQHLLTMQVSLNPRRFTEYDQRWQFYQRVLERVRTLPGVEQVSAASPLPLKGEASITSYALDETAAVLHTVLPDYFRTMGMRLRAGRDFTPAEIEQKVSLAVVDTNLARLVWPNENPIGKRLLWRARTKRQQWVEVVGVVEHVKTGGIHEDGRPQLYLPYLSHPLYDLSLVVRGKTELLSLGQVIKKEVEQLGTERPVHNIRAMREYVADELAETRFTLILIGGFAVLALTLCLVGLYSVIAYFVSQRTHEIGIRLALGAQAADVLKLVIRQGMLLVLSGVGVGLVGAFALTRLLAKLLYGVSATDPLTFAAIALLLTVTALLACYMPARRATKVDPLVALRHE